MALVFMAAVAWMAWTYIDFVCPLATRLVQRMGRHFIRTLWIQPFRRWGLPMTIWIWLLLAASLTTVIGVAAFANGNVGPMLTAVVLWLLVAAWWYVIRWIARRRFDPRPLPTRHHDRRRTP